jgi:hypothetical protein
MFCPMSSYSLFHLHDFFCIFMSPLIHSYHFSYLHVSSKTKSRRHANCCS